ncbi:NAD-dependent epimerase/dehydratase family protein [Microvirga brassicacearum]|uniref:NAD-dependent epimerase/dehydratase family protein n=1 Tax=Microvirga brassicacearum TaxID=2580413 RepID=A0A5N3PCW7_9HYPH|nr:NAD-dependent epimerase/dehydratase family protein [Microvirga brassicacearum]KAB0267485.1 NAD-dependent epimerase/dehydratase family protein [Microvirga brassicacearum]
MKILIVGGTGMIGGHAADFLAAQGNSITIAARRPPPSTVPMAAYPILLGDYTQGNFTEADLASFDAVLFAAGNDIRHLPKDMDEQEFWDRTQIEGVPRFVALAKRAGVRRVVQLGSYYHQVMPHLIAENAYVRARYGADEGARALATPDFNISTLNPPSIVGVIPGVPARRYETLTAWAKGQRPEIPDYAPAGGTNYMSVRSLCEAIWGALQHAEPGRAYLIGDANLSFRDFFQMIFDAAGSSRRLEERDQEHPLLPDAFIVPGRGKVLAYEPDPVETALLGYTRGDVRRAVNEVVAMVDAA